jgi:hypothetical protein
MAEASFTGAPWLAIVGYEVYRPDRYPPNALSNAAYEAMPLSEKLRLLQEAQATLRLMEADLTDTPERAADRESARLRLSATNAAVADSQEAVDRLLDLATLLPSFWDNCHLGMCEDHLSETLDDIVTEDDANPVVPSPLGWLADTRSRLMAQAQAEARILDLNLDDLLRARPEALRADTDLSA